METKVISTPREDNVLEGILYPQFCYRNELGAESITKEMLQEEIEKYTKETDPFVKNYLWHRDNLSFLPQTIQDLQCESVMTGSCKPTGKFLLFKKFIK